MTSEKTLMEMLEGSRVSLTKALQIANEQTSPEITKLIAKAIKAVEESERMYLPINTMEMLKGCRTRMSEALKIAEVQPFPELTVAIERAIETVKEFERLYKLLPKDLDLDKPIVTQQTIGVSLKYVEDMIRDVRNKYHQN